MTSIFLHQCNCYTRYSRYIAPQFNIIYIIQCEKWQKWWRHQMEAFSALLAMCAGNSPVTGGFPAQRPVTRSFDVYFDLHLNKRLNKQWRGWWIETPSRPLWRHCNELHVYAKMGRLHNGHRTARLHVRAAAGFCQLFIQNLSQRRHGVLKVLDLQQRKIKATYYSPIGEGNRATPVIPLTKDRWCGKGFISWRHQSLLSLGVPALPAVWDNWETKG